MSMAPRIGVLAFILIAATFSPTAVASGCLSIETRFFGNGLHVIANSGREIMLGLVAADPGDGLAATAIITPAICTSGVPPVPQWNDAENSPLPDLSGPLDPTIPASFPLLP